MCTAGRCAPLLQASGRHTQHSYFSYYTLVTVNESLPCSHSYTHLLLSLSRTHTCNHFLCHLAEYLIIHISSCSTNINACNSVFYLVLSFFLAFFYPRIWYPRIWYPRIWYPRIWYPRIWLSGYNSNSTPRRHHCHFTFRRVNC